MDTQLAWLLKIEERKEIKKKKKIHPLLATYTFKDSFPTENHNQAEPTRLGRGTSVISVAILLQAVFIVIGIMLIR